MIGRYRVDVTTAGKKWVLRLMMPTHVGHASAGYLCEKGVVPLAKDAEEFDTRVEAQDAKRDRVSWAQFTFTSGARTGREYYLKPKKVAAPPPPPKVESGQPAKKRKSRAKEAT